MSYDSTTIYTIGTALNRAKDHDIPVEVLVDGQWLRGRVVDVDGHGVVLHSDDNEHSVLRMDSVAAVRIFTAVPRRASITTGARPMPGAQAAGM